MRDQNLREAFLVLFDTSRDVAAASIRANVKDRLKLVEDVFALEEKVREIFDSAEDVKMEISRKTAISELYDKGVVDARFYNAVYRAGVTIVEDLEARTYEELAAIKGLGPKTIQENFRSIEAEGYCIRPKGFIFADEISNTREIERNEGDEE